MCKYSVFFRVGIEDTLYSLHTERLFINKARNFALTLLFSTYTQCVCVLYFRMGIKDTLGRVRLLVVLSVQRYNQVLNIVSNELLLRVILDF